MCVLVLIIITRLAWIPPIRPDGPLLPLVMTKKLFGKCVCLYSMCVGGACMAVCRAVCLHVGRHSGPLCVQVNRW